MLKFLDSSDFKVEDRCDDWASSFLFPAQAWSRGIGHHHVYIMNWLKWGLSPLDVV